jgi:hypothetical protein
LAREKLSRRHSRCRREGYANNGRKVTGAKNENREPENYD